MSTVDLPAFATPEFSFVAACTHWPLTPALAQRVRDLAAEVTDWQRVLEIVDRHRVVGLVNKGMQYADVVLPPEIRTVLGDQVRFQAVRELSFTFETVRLVRLFEAAGVPVCVLKGAATAVSIFGVFGVRYSMDIDLIVDPEAVPEASRLLRDAGYVRTDPVEDVGAAAIAERMRRFKDMVFEHPGTGAIVELHWRLFQNPRLLRHENGLPVETAALLEGERVPVLERNFAHLYLCAHGGEHGWARLKWLADLGALLAQDGEAAQTIYRQARARGLQRMVGPGLVLSHRIYDTPLPAQVAHDLSRDRRMRWLTRIAWSSLVGDESGAELEERSLGTARKNLGHYLVSNDPRHWWHEFNYDRLDTAGDSDGGAPRLMMLLSRVWAILARRGSAPR